MVDPIDPTKKPTRDFYQVFKIVVLKEEECKKLTEKKKKVKKYLFAFGRSTVGNACVYSDHFMKGVYERRL